MKKALIGILAFGVLAGCGGGQGLRTLTGVDGPDEFSVLPSAPLQMPENTSQLPAPTPGGRNLVDPTPKADAITALGGRPNAVFAGGVPASDRALVAAVSRNGVPVGIRQTIADEDTAKRGRGAWGLSRLWGGDRYFSAYRRQALDAYAELARLRALGIETPSAPPVK